jgi:flagellar hook-basal body complex protein FliE
MDEIKIESKPILSAGGQQADKTVSRSDYGDIIKEAVSRIDGLEKNANKSVMDLLNGEAEIHETMIALQKADVSMRLMLAVRNKAIEAYKEIMHMQF